MYEKMPTDSDIISVDNARIARSLSSSTKNKPRIFCGKNFFLYDDKKNRTTYINTSLESLFKSCLR